MKRILTISALAVAVLAAPVLASPPVAQRPICQTPKVTARDAKRVEPCRKPPVPPIIDPTPMFLASTGPSAAAEPSDLS